LAFAPQTGQNHRLLNFAATLFAQTPASGKIANAHATTQTTMFCPLSPEAYLLTKKNSIIH
jgi:hypothetical protein